MKIIQKYHPEQKQINISLFDCSMSMIWPFDGV